MTRELHAIVEREIGRWRVTQHDHQEHLEEALPRPHVIAVTHSVGSFGAEVARIAGARLGFPVYDREIVHHIASNADVHLETVASLDERARGRVGEYLEALARELNFDHDDFGRALVATVTALWEHGPCVLVGHGCVHVVPRSHALTVRITAPEAARITHLAPSDARHQAPIRRYVRRVDRERATFHRRVFGASLDDPARFDLVVNTATLVPEAAAAVIVEAYRGRFTTVASFNGSQAESGQPRARREP